MGDREGHRRSPAATDRKRRAVEDALAHYSLDGDNVHASLDALRDLLETDKVFLYTLAQRPDGDDLMITRDATVGYPHERWRSVFEDFIRGRGVTWGIYNAVHPEPAQRDRVLRTDDIVALTEGRNREVEEPLYRRLGTYGEDTMRVLVCDGPSMLAWVGVMQPDATTERQRALLTELVPAFRRRLVLERLISEAALSSSAAGAALEQVNAAAWVLGSTGRIAHANAAGRAQFDRDPDGTMAALESCVASAGLSVPDPRFKVTALRGGGGGNAGHVVVAVADRRAASNGVPEAASRFGLTPAQTRVLERVARGVSNATIASELGVAERTVEAHVTAILVKAQVPSRAALIVQIFRDHRTA